MVELKNLINASVTLRYNTDKICAMDKDLFFSAKINTTIRSLLAESLDSSLHSLKSVVSYRFNQELYRNAADLYDDFELKKLTALLDDQLERVDVLVDRSDVKSSVADVRLTKVSLPAEYVKMKEFKIIHALNIPRPQLAFLDKPDNSSILTLPKLTFPKPNCTCPGEFKLSYGVHPYLNELESFSHPSWIYEIEKEILFKSFSDTPFSFIQTANDFEMLLSTLSTQQAFAVDLEHHSYRSFEGFVCLMQISTRTHDFIIDTLECRSLMPKLNTVFSNPSILKVFHGSESDIIWLQRDFGIYVVGMFDTYYAAKLLNLGSHSLSHLVQFYANITLDKKFQLADWRIRPLPQEMIDYARSDTHYLLYIFDRMRQQLLQENKGYSLLKQVLLSSTQRCKQLYKKEPYKEMSWRSVIDRYNKKLTNEQIAVLRATLKWRDEIARLEDESLHYVMPRMMIMRIAELIPNSVNDIMRCFKPCPPLVKQHAHDLLLAIKTFVKECKFEQIVEMEKMQEAVHTVFEEESELDNFHSANENSVSESGCTSAAILHSGNKDSKNRNESISNLSGSSDYTNNTPVINLQIPNKPKIHIAHCPVKKSIFDDDDESPILLPSVNMSFALEELKQSNTVSEESSSVTTPEANHSSSKQTIAKNNSKSKQNVSNNSATSTKESTVNNSDSVVFAREPNQSVSINDQ